MVKTGLTGGCPLTICQWVSGLVPCSRLRTQKPKGCDNPNSRGQRRGVGGGVVSKKLLLHRTSWDSPDTLPQGTAAALRTRGSAGH